ncbi:MAG: hypothetical protein ABI824_01525 [Acidobacteriota bacterium]
MSKPAPDLQPTSNALHAEATFDCRATVALLKAMSPLVWASHAAALLAASYHAWLPLLPWGLVIYFAIRVRLDAALLEMLACDPMSAPGRLDQWLSRAGLRARVGELSIVERNIEERTIEVRCQGSRRLARYLAGACLLQLGATAVVFLRSNP